MVVFFNAYGNKLLEKPNGYPCSLLLIHYFLKQLTPLLIGFQVDDILETKLDRKFQLVMDKGTLDAIGLHPDGPIKR